MGRRDSTPTQASTDCTIPLPDGRVPLTRRRRPVPTSDREPRVPFSLTPKDSSFYPLFTASAENLVAAADVLSEFIHDHARRPELAGKLRDLEHAADQTTHAIFRQLNTSFVTPFDREDIYNLASDLDDVMDFVEAAADLVVLTGLGTLPAEMSQQVALWSVGTAPLTRESVPSAAEAYDDAEPIPASLTTRWPRGVKSKPKK